MRAIKAVRTIDADALVREFEALKAMGTECYWSDVIERIQAAPAAEEMRIEATIDRRDMAQMRAMMSLMLAIGSAEDAENGEE